MSATIAETKSWLIGPYRVQQRPRPDNFSWPVYIVFLGDVLIGKQFSIPSESDCAWLERTAGVYATVSAKRRGYSARGNAALRHQARVRRQREIA